MEPPGPAEALMTKVPVLKAKAAPTVTLLFIVTSQVEAEPEHAPDHPAKVEVELGVAVRVTVVPMLKAVPLGLFATIPDPVPDSVIVRT